MQPNKALFAGASAPSFGHAVIELVVVGMLAFGFAFGADWGLGRALKLAGLEPRPAVAAPPAAAPANDE